MRSTGHGHRADVAERYAAWARIAREQPETTLRVYRMVGQLRATPSLRGVVDAALDSAMSLLGADFGNVQLLDQKAGQLRIVSHSGFANEFLEYFSAVDDTSSACGRAAKDCAQVVIADVNDDRAFRPHRFIAAASHFRAVQSTPLVDRTGRLVGVVSTHFRKPHRPLDPDLVVMARFGELVADVVRARLEPQQDTLQM
jgi:GAF domain-containing protein